ncbi:MAG TPA: outer membrane beta-barrel protein [Chitinophagaceae bacterium]|nr:outer membrane beta-barrel protein [Chitinophagaceae bacterium]
MSKKLLLISLGITSLIFGAAQGQSNFSIGPVVGIGFTGQTQVSSAEVTRYGLGQAPGIPSFMAPSGGGYPEPDDGYQGISLVVPVQGDSSETHKGLILPFFGVMAQYRLTDEVRLEGQFLFDPIGVRSSFLGQSTTSEVDYLKIPLDVQYGWPLGPGELLVGAGPYLAFGIGGNSGGRQLKFGNNSNLDGLRRGDWGLDLQAQFLLKKGWLFGLGFDQGIANILPGGNSSNRIQNHELGLSVGYQFRGKSK